MRRALLVGSIVIVVISLFGHYLPEDPQAFGLLTLVPSLFLIVYIFWVRLFWNGGFGMSHSGKGSSHLTRLRWRPLTGTTLPSA